MAALEQVKDAPRQKLFAAHFTLILACLPLHILKYESHYGQVTLRKHSVTCSCQSGSQELDLLKMVALAGAWLLKEPK